MNTHDKIQKIITKICADNGIDKRHAEFAILCKSQSGCNYCFTATNHNGKQFFTCWGVGFEECLNNALIVLKVTPKEFQP